MNNRASYNKLQAQARHNSAEMLRRFKELHPDRFAELLTQAKTELNKPKLLHTHTTPSIQDTIKQLRNGRKSYFIHTKDHYNTSHLYHVLLTSPDQALEAITTQYPQVKEHNEVITKIEKCICPLCH